MLHKLVKMGNSNNLTTALSNSANESMWQVATDSLFRMSTEWGVANVCIIVHSILQC